MKLSEYAKKQGVSYRTAWNWWKAGQLAGRQMPSGTVIVEDEAYPFSRGAPQRAVIYARVSAAEKSPNLDSQAERLVAYCMAQGYQVAQVVKEIGSGVNDSRPKFLKLLADSTIPVI